MLADVRKAMLSATVILGLMGVGVAWAQVTTASLRGTARDSQGGALPGVTMTVKNIETGLARTLVTEGNGTYIFTNLPPGTYEITAELTGFRRAVESGIGLSIGQDAVLMITMDIGQLEEAVIVTGEVPLIDTKSGSVSGLVEGNTVRTLPLNGRSFDQLTFLNPGVTSYSLGGQNVQNGPGVKMSISGARPESVYFMLDGTNILDHSNFTPGSAAGNNLGVDAIREFRVFAHNYSAEIGVRAGGAVSVVTRSGTNDFHGSAFEFIRNEAFDARNYFDQGDNLPFQRNQFGFNIGGPIVRQKTFFFANVEWLRETLGRTILGVVPNAEARRGNLPGLTIPVNPAIVPYLDLWPLPNGRDFGDGTGERVDAFDQPTNETYVMARVDHAVSPNDNVFVRFVWDKTTVTSPQAQLVWYLNELRSENRFFTAQHTHIFKSNLLNEFRFALNRTQPEEDAFAAIDLNQSLKFFPHAATVGSLTFSAGRGSADGAAISAAGVGGNAPRVFAQNIIQFGDTVSQQLGRHSLRYGVDLQLLHIDGLLNEDTNGEYAFLGIGNLLRGTPDQILAPAPGSEATRRFRQVLFAGFIQDDIRLSDRLTLNAGVRYEFTTEPDEADGKISNLKTPTDPEPTIGYVWEKNNSLKDLAPRAGIAWDVFGNSRTSIRGGAGVFYSQVIGRNWYTYILRQTPFSQFTVDTNPPFPNPFINGVASTLQQNDMIDGNLKTPTMYHYNVSFQQQLTKNNMVEVALVGSRGVNLLRNYEGNTAYPVVQPDGSYFYPPGAPTRNPNFGPIFVLTSDAHSWYKSVQVRWVRQLSGGLQFQASYTGAKSEDEASNLQRGQGRNSPSFTQIPDRPDLDKGYASFHVAHAVSASAVYELPRVSGPRVLAAIVNGWQVGGILRAQSGTPFTAETGFNRSRDGSTTVADRPNVRAGQSDNPVLGTPERWFDPTVFELPPAGTYGTVGRNTIAGPGMATLDLLLGRQFEVRGVTIDFRAEGFNVLNRANFGLPRNRIFNSRGQIPGSVGSITTTTTSARQVQFGVKVSF